MNQSVSRRCVSGFKLEGQSSEKTSKALTISPSLNLIIGLKFQTYILTKSFFFLYRLIMSKL